MKGSKLSSSDGDGSTTSSSLVRGDNSKIRMTDTDTNIAKDDAEDPRDDDLKEEDHSTTGIVVADSTHSNTRIMMLMQNDDVSSSSQSQPQPHETTFPQQLMDLIETETTDDKNEQKAIEWLSTGDKFIIRDKVTLERSVLPKYFHKKCKFMSFVRKLYRWGFRQVDKDFSSGMMIFMHKHFTRGDKKKCLAMHSIVNSKKPSAPAVSMNVSSRRTQVHRDTVPTAGVLPNHLQFQSNRPIYGGGDYRFPSNVVQGRAALDMLERRVNPGFSMNYGLGAQMQMPYPSYLGLNWTRRQPALVSGLPNNRSEIAPVPFAASLRSNQGYSAALPEGRTRAGISSMGPPSEEVILASRIMREDPTIDAWRALQLAKMHLNGTSTSSELRRP